MRSLTLFLLIASSINSLAQSSPIALTNHVRYKNGDSYIDPSMTYAGTGFLMEAGGKVYAVTAKHVLCVARNRNSKSVEINNDISQWILREKDGSDSVVVDRLINEDANEILEGPVSTILERDWLVFSIKSASPDIQILKPRYDEILDDEEVFIIGNPYAESETRMIRTKVVSKLGMDILLESPGGSISGLSGSPVIDANGFVIGVFSSMSNFNGNDVVVSTSTEYFRKVIEGREDLNISKKDYGDVIFQTVLKTGPQKAIEQYQELANDPDNYYIYNLRSSNRNGLLEAGNKLMEMKRYKDAVEILKFNVTVNSSYFHNYNRLASALLMSGNKDEAIRYFRMSTEKLNDPAGNEAFKELEKLGVKN